MSWKEAALLLLLASFGTFAIWVLLAVLWRAWAGWGEWGMTWHMPMMGYGMAFGMLVIPLLSVFLLGVGAYFVLRPTSTPRAHEVSNALETARMRYARGEISREQYEQMRRDLE